MYRTVLVAAIVLGPVPAADAQTSLAVDLRLTSQTPWTLGNDRDLHDLRIRFVGTNTGLTTLKHLTVVGSIGAPFISREGFEEAITTGPSSVVAFHTSAVEGSLEPGRSEDFELDIDMTTMAGVQQDDSKVYPLRVELRSRGATVGQLFTTAIHLVQEPQRPMLLTWWLELAAGPAFGPDGRLHGTRCSSRSWRRAARSVRSRPGCGR